MIQQTAGLRNNYFQLTKFDLRTICSLPTFLFCERGCREQRICDNHIT
jgi:hypothetical protein